MERLAERTSLDGIMLIAMGLLVILFAPLAKIAAWVAVAYGAWTLLKAENDG